MEDILDTKTTWVEDVKYEHILQENAKFWIVGEAESKDATLEIMDWTTGVVATANDYFTARRIVKSIESHHRGFVKIIENSREAVEFVHKMVSDRLEYERQENL